MLTTLPFLIFYKIWVFGMRLVPSCSYISDMKMIRYEGQCMTLSDIINAWPGNFGHGRLILCILDRKYAQTLIFHRFLQWCLYFTDFCSNVYIPQIFATTLIFHIFLQRRLYFTDFCSDAYISQIFAATLIFHIFLQWHFPCHTHCAVPVVSYPQLIIIRCWQ